MKKTTKTLLLIALFASVTPLFSQENKKTITTKEEKKEVKQEPIKAENKEYVFKFSFSDANLIWEIFQKSNAGHTDVLRISELYKNQFLTQIPQDTTSTKK